MALELPENQLPASLQTVTENQLVLVHSCLARPVRALVTELLVPGVDGVDAALQVGV